MSRTAAKFVPVCWKTTRNKTDFMGARTCKIKPEETETSFPRSSCLQGWISS